VNPILASVDYRSRRQAQLQRQLLDAARIRPLLMREDEKKRLFLLLGDQCPLEALE
jgi:hypothetical protein